VARGRDRTGVSEGKLKGPEGRELGSVSWPVGDLFMVCFGRLLGVEEEVVG
jgi:hypothetical protein